MIESTEIEYATNDGNENSENTSNEFQSRQSELISTEHLKTHIHIVGCGAVGSALAPMLAKAGYYKFTLYDNDRIDLVNIGPQSFSASQIGQIGRASCRERV